MKKGVFTVLLLLAVMLLKGPAVLAEEQVVHEVEPGVKEILRQMSDYLKTADQFTFEAETFFDQVLDTGQKLRYTSSVDISTDRPDRLRANRRGDLYDLQIYYSGKTFTVYDSETNRYKVTEVPNRIDKMIETLSEDYGIAPPLTDFIVSDPFPLLTKNIQSGFYVGLHDVKGIPTHHLALTQEDIDWEIWIEAGKRRLPLMFVITYKKVIGVPQYTAVFTDWDFAPRLADSYFEFVPPEGAEQVEFSREQADKKE